MKKIAILFSGKGSTLEFLLDNLSDIEVSLTITNNPQAEGISISKKHNVPCFIIDTKLVTQDEFDYLAVQKLIQYDVDLTIFAGFMKKVTPYFIQHVKCINLHPSLLPLHKGLNAIERSYLDENPYGGVSIHYVSEDLDAGEIILQESILKKNMSLDEYTSKIKEKEKETLLNSINLILK